MKILITGGAGFIGSNLCEKLLIEDNKVICLDFFNTKKTSTIQKFNLSFIKNRKNLKFININILQEKKIFKIIKKEKPHFIIHCAAKAGVRESLKNPLIYTTINILGTQNILEGIRLYNPTSKIIIFSSSSVYGIQKNIYFKESMKPNPKSVYGVSKYTMELIAKQYYDFYKLPIIIVRPFSIYGPRGRIDMAPFLLLKAAELNKPFIKFGTNKDNKRDWTFINDLVQGITGIIKYHKFSYIETVNLGKGTPIGIDDFVNLKKKMIKKYLNKSVDIINEKRTKEELPITYADISKAQKLFGYTPKTDFEKGINEFYKYYIKYRDFYLKSFNSKSK